MKVNEGHKLHHSDQYYLLNTKTNQGWTWPRRKFRFSRAKPDDIHSQNKVYTYFEVSSLHPVTYNMAVCDT